MEEFRNLELTALLDMLLYTARYTKMLSDGAPKDEANACRELIQQLQKEIEGKKEYR